MTPNDTDRDQISSPVLLSVPHAGRDYPASLLSAARVDAAVLRKLEDRHADALVSLAASEGHHSLIARTPRALIDLNRAEDDLEYHSVAPPRGPLHFRPTGKARGGLGLIPDRLHGHGPLWRAQPSCQDVQDRLTSIHRPWHARIAEALKARRRAFGIAILLDIHSMPPLARQRAQPHPPRIVVSDCHGRSCASPAMETVLAEIAASGLPMARNHPYAGGHTIQRHGDPRHAIHAIQIEFDRSLYLDAELDEPGPGLRTIQKLVARLAQGLTQQLAPAWPLAAE